MMKNFRRTIAGVMTLVCVTFLAVSCEKGVADDVLGTYSGNMLITTQSLLGPRVDTLENSSVIVTKVDESTVKLSLSAITIQVTETASIPLTGLYTNATVDKSGKNYSLTGNLDMQIDLINASVTGPFDGTINGNALSVDFDLSVAMGTTTTIPVGVKFIPAE